VSSAQANQNLTSRLEQVKGLRHRVDRGGAERLGRRPAAADARGRSSEGDVKRGRTRRATRHVRPLLARGLPAGSYPELPVMRGDAASRSSLGREAAKLIVHSCFARTNAIVSVRRGGRLRWRPGSRPGAKLSPVAGRGPERRDYETLLAASSMRSHTAVGWEASEAWLAASSIVLRGFIRCAIRRSLSG
jgi:hypothetical protein